MVPFRVNDQLEDAFRPAMAMLNSKASTVVHKPVGDVYSLFHLVFIWRRSQTPQ